MLLSSLALAQSNPSTQPTTRTVPFTIFILDYSGSMMQTYHQGTNEVRKQLMEMDENENFDIIIMSENFFHFNKSKATDENKRQAILLMDEKATPRGDIAPIVEKTLSMAFNEKPTIIVLFTNRDYEMRFKKNFPSTIVNNLNIKKKVVFNVWASGSSNDTGFDDLAKASRDNGGIIKYLEH